MDETLESRIHVRRIVDIDEVEGGEGGESKGTDGIIKSD
jgi:hypothetical protein